MKTDAASLYSVEPLAEGHDRAAFSCGVEPLNRYLREQAGQDARKKVAVPFLLVHRETRHVAGFYTLANTAVEAGRLPADLVKRLPKYPLVPATLLGRLAIATDHHGRGLGEFLLLDALRRSWQASQQVASFAVLVDAKDDSARAFYQKYGFISFADNPDRLFLTMKTVAMLFS